MKTMIAMWAASAALVATVGLTPTANAAEFTLRCAHDHPVSGGNEGQRHYEWQEFKRVVEEKSKGRIEVYVFGASQLGDMPAMVQNMQIGTIDCLSLDAATAGPFVAPYAFVATPYLIESRKHADLLMDPNRPFFKEVSALLKTNLNAIAIGSASVPPRSVYSRNKPVTKPEDLVGMKVRTMQSPLQIKAWQLLGANPTAIAFAEVYTALQTGTVDAAENPAFLVWGMKHYEPVKYFSLTNHMINVGVLSISDRAMRKLPADLQQVVRDAGVAGGIAGRKFAWDMDADFIKRIKDSGVTVVDNIDVRPFVAKLAPLHDELAKENKAEKLLTIIRAEAVEARKS